MPELPSVSAEIDWSNIDTVLLDMDGTLLDLKYDNHLWNVELPKRYAQQHSLSLADAETALFDYMASVRGHIHFYCLDHWAEHTGLDMLELHQCCVELIDYRPGAVHFLEFLRTTNKRSVLVTNAHRMSLEVKCAAIDLCTRLDRCISCHDYGRPKEDSRFWQQLSSEEPFDPARTLFIDDNAEVLAAAAAYGIQHLVTISQPDSARPARQQLAYPVVNDLAHLI